MHKEKADYWIKQLNLEEHPEGGFYKETYRKDLEYEGRSLATNIFYLLPSDRVSKFHRLQCDEIWYFHYGSPLTFYFFTPNGHYEEYILGLDPERNEHLSLLVPAQTIFGALVQEPDSFTLVSCNMTPGFHFEDFEMFSEQDLFEQFPDKKSIIKKLT
ncbi:MAG: cupin domain-containing protein [Bacteroidales bacterium]